MYIEKIGSVVKDIGSVMITGLQISDSKKCFFGLARELIQKGEPIWLFDGTLNGNEQKKLIEYAISQGYRIYFFCVENMFSQTIDIMSISDNLTKKAEILSDAVCDYKTDIKREVAVRFFKNAVTAKMSDGEAFRVADVIGQNLEQIKLSIKETDLLSEDKKQEETIFLSSSEVKNLAYYLNKRKERLHTQAIRKRLYQICEKLGMPVRSPHKIRKTYGSILLDNDVNSKIIEKQMGHAGINVTKEYYYRDRSRIDEKRAAINSVRQFALNTTLNTMDI